MSKNMIRIFDCETQEVIDREMTAQEWANCQSVEAQSKAKADEISANAAAKAALLAKLGISAEEAALLLG